ncbi:hypothetical protein CgunFtcFv8_025318 [Champsocephalus gunnari]|uniref:LRAT domain-containing protein n=1 Tax=Champsocephalus gunnari TaxID=52237 RepID=A0AAN8CAN5_CHAGU|nr:hypothetical protein CgunFtcFv8_025318 [Champsocephalus gunnari]
MATPHDTKPEIGDLIEIVRGSFQHWAVYVGDGFIVHLTSDPEVACSNSMSSVPNNKALVTKRELRDVVGTDEWKINNILDGKHEPHSKEDIVRDARAMVGEAPYDIFFGNCEHFATFIRYGKPESRQVGSESFFLGGGLE